jgi:uncharacterized protein YbbC (DUF1343 family)
MRLLLSILLLLLPLQPAYSSPVGVGAEVLAATDFHMIRGKRVGIITNPSAMVDGIHVVDLLHKGGVKVAALFGPEHGIRGTAEDGEKVGGGTDKATGAAIYSLYGETKRPSKESLRGIDVLLFDIQDVGARFYTYISTLGMAMQGAAEAGIPFIVLDRPNPLGGNYVSGFVLSPPHRSFVGLYPIPIAHGLTVGELAVMIKGENLLPGLEKLDLRVVKMEGWRREMRWPGTGLPWVATSPNLASYEATLLYPGICFFEATSVSEGRGTSEPFRLVGAPGIDADAIVRRLKEAKLPGVDFEAASFTPRSLPGVSSRPKYRGKTIPGIRIRITEQSKVLPVETGMHLLAAFVQAAGEGKGREAFFRKAGFIELSGTRRLLETIGRRSPEEVIGSWQDEVGRFREMRKKYLLYE